MEEAHILHHQFCESLLWKLHVIMSKTGLEEIGA